MDNRLVNMIQCLSISEGNCRRHAQQQLESWWNSSLILFRDAYNKKFNEINQLYETLVEDLEDYKQRQIVKITEQKCVLSIEEIEQLRSQLQTLIQVQSTPGSIDDLQISRSTNLLDVPTMYSHIRHSLLRTMPVQSYRFSSTCRAMTCNHKRDEILLYERDELILYNVNGTLGGSVSWSTTKDGFVSDIVWCSRLDCFLVLGRMALSVFDPHLYTCTNVEQVRSGQSNHFIALTYIEHNETVLICCHDPRETIRQYSLSSQWSLMKIWSKENLINEDDTGIRCIRVSPSGSQLCLIIKNRNDQFRIGLYSMDLTQLLTTIPIVPSLSPLNSGRSVDFMLYLTSFVNERWWLVVYGNGTHEHSLLLVDMQTGKSEIMMEDAVLNACMLDEQYLVVRLKQAMLIYDIQ